MGDIQAQVGKILQKIIAKATYELQQAAENGNLEDVMDHYGVTLEEEALPVDEGRSKILVLGALNGKPGDYKLSAKKMGIRPDNLEFESDYRKLKNFNAATLRNSFKYSDIIYGSAPHKMKNMGDVSSLLAGMQKEPQYYPRVIRADVGDDRLKITITSFREALSKTRYYETRYAAF